MGIRIHKASVKLVKDYVPLYGRGATLTTSQESRALGKKKFSSNAFLESRPRINRNVWRIHESDDWTVSLSGESSDLESAFPAHRLPTPHAPFSSRD